MEWYPIGVTDVSPYRLSLEATTELKTLLMRFGVRDGIEPILSDIESAITAYQAAVSITQGSLPGATRNNLHEVLKKGVSLLNQIENLDMPSKTLLRDRAVTPRLKGILDDVVVALRDAQTLPNTGLPQYSKLWLASDIRQALEQRGIAVNGAKTGVFYEVLAVVVRLVARRPNTAIPDVTRLVKRAMIDFTPTQRP